MTARKFTLPAGTTNRHRWHKEAAAALSSVTRTFNMLRQIYGTHGGEERESLVSVYGAGGHTNPKAVKVYEDIGEAYGWQITRENADALAAEFRDALPRCMETVPVEDNRKTPEQEAEQAERNRQAEADRQAKAAELAETVDELAAEIRKQYPDAEPKGKKSEQARAAANLKRILTARGLRASVKSDSFSMGDSVTADVLTPDVPPDMRKELDEIAERFSYSTFDPMTDYSGYKTDPAGKAWRQVHGSTKYCRIEWTRSDENRAAAVEFLGGADPEHESHQLWSGAHCRAAEFWAKWAEDHKAPEPAEPVQGGGFSIEKHHHTKRGFDFWLVVLADRVERDEFTRLRSSCKAAGGWYSRKWGSTPGGFAFKEQEQAGAWAVQEFGGDQPPPDPRPSKPRGTSKRGPAIAEKFRTMADKIDEEVTAKRGDHLENTPKRQREGMSRRIEADRLERTAQGLRALADLHEAGEVPEELAKFTSKKAVYSALGVRTTSTGYYHIAPTDEPTDDSPEAAALWALLDGKDPEQEKADRLAELMAGLPKIAGYFPTPADIVDEMLDRAKIEAAHSVLEPSAGSGAILDGIAELAADPLAVHYEVNPTLCEILRAKGYDSRPIDFMQREPGQFLYDRVVMNPPFENLQDVDHVRHAYDFLKAGGRLVAIMSPGPFFRDTKKAREFREWFEDLGGEVEEIEAGAFKESGTGVASRLVVIDKPEDDAGELLCKDAPHLGRISKADAEWLAGELTEQQALF